MRFHLVGLICFWLMFQACQPADPAALAVDLAPSTEISPFAHGLSPASAYDTTSATVWAKTQQEITGLPDTLHDLQVYYENLQIRQLVYYGFKAGMMDSTYYESWTQNVVFNEADYTSEFVDQQMHFVYGRDADSNHVFIFDANNNEDLSDDTATVVPPDAPTDDWQALESYLPQIPVEYELYDGEHIVPAQTKIMVHPYLQLPPMMRQRKMMFIGSASHNTGILTYKGKQYAMWSANPMSAGEHTPYQSRFWLEPMEGEAFPSRPARQETLLLEMQQEALEDTSSNKPSIPENFYPRLSEPFEIGDLVTLGEDAFEISEISPLGDQLVLNRTNADQVGLRTGLTAPEFEGPTLDSTTVQLSSYRGKFVLIDFWGTWCGPCVGEVPYLRAAYDGYSRDKFDILAVANDDPEALRSFVEKENLPWTQIIQQEENENLREVLDTYRISGYPTTFLLNPEGVIIAREGRLRGRALGKTLEKYLGPATL